MLHARTYRDRYPYISLGSFTAARPFGYRAPQQEDTVLASYSTVLTIAAVSSRQTPKLGKCR